MFLAINKSENIKYLLLGLVAVFTFLYLSYDAHAQTPDQLLFSCTVKTPDNNLAVTATATGSCTVPANVNATRLVFSYALDDGGDIYINSQLVFSLPPVFGTEVGIAPISLPIPAPGSTITMTVIGRNAWIGPEVDHYAQYVYARGTLDLWGQPPTSLPPPPPPLGPPPPPADTTPPVISNVRITNITTTTATVLWDTNELGSSQIEFCRTVTRCGINTTLDSQLTLSHSTNLSGLLANTTYYVWAKSRDGAGNLGTLGYFLFRTLSQAPPPPPPPPPAPPPTPVIISNIQVTNVTRDSATVAWDTDRPADSRIYSCSFGLFCFNTLVNDQNLTTSHTFNISGLRADRNYYIQLTATDANGGYGQSSIVIFRTLLGLIVSNTRVTNTTQSSVTVAWDTNYPADSRIIVCQIFLFCFFSAPVRDPLVTSSHVMTISNLRSGTIYYFQVSSVDPLGYFARSSLTSFRTQ